MQLECIMLCVIFLHSDPVPLFEQAVQCQQKLITAQDLEIENKQLRETLTEYNSEFAHVKNQGW